MSGGMAGAMTQQAPVEQRAAQTNPLLGQMQGNLLNQFASRMMGGGMSPIQQLMMGRQAPKLMPGQVQAFGQGAMPQQNRYQQMFANRQAPQMPQIPAASQPVNVRGMNSLMEAPAPQTLQGLLGDGEVALQDPDRATLYLNNIPDYMMPGWTGGGG